MYAIIDIETTGGSARIEKITEIAIYLYDGNQITGEFVSLINPERNIPYFITNLTGITNEMVEDAPRFYEIAKKIVEHRAEKGAFKSRKEIIKVSRMGEKVFEQCAGFLRIPNSSNPLDNSAVHPESYHIVEKMAKDSDSTIEVLLKDENIRKKIKIEKYVVNLQN